MTVSQSVHFALNPCRSLFAASLLLLTLCAAASAESSRLDSANELMKSGDYSGAIAILRAESASAPDDPRIAYYLGKALSRANEGKEAESVLKSALMVMPEDPALNLELGILYYNKKVLDEASDYFEQVAYLVPNDNLALQAQNYLEKIAVADMPKSWGLNIIAGLQYDSNVMLNGTNQPLPEGISGKSDWSAVLNLGGTYCFLKTGPFEAAAGYTLYQNLHDTLRDFDVSQHLLEVSGTYSFTSELKLKGTYIYEYMFLGREGYDYANSFTAALTHASTTMGYSSLEYRYKETDYWNTTRFADNAFRDGGNNTVTLTHLLQLGKLGNSWASYAFESDKTRHSYWNYIGNRFQLGFQSVLPLGLTALLTGEAAGKRYDAEDPSYSMTRNDKQYTFGASLTENFSERYSITVGEVYVRNDSNIPQFDYTRSLTSLMFNMRF